MKREREREKRRERERGERDEVHREGAVRVLKRARRDTQDARECAQQVREEREGRKR